MAPQTPLALRRLCRDYLPPLLEAADGRRMLEDVSAIVDTDRWNSFDRFHESTDTVVGRYEAAGVTAEVERIQTGGRIGSGRWIIQEAQDVRSALVDIVSPRRERLLDYRQCPWHVVQWTSGTPRGGMTCDLVIADTEEAIRRFPPDGLNGKVVLTKASPRGLMKLLADRGAAAAITDPEVAASANAVAWTKFGWGAVPMEHATASLVGLVLSANQGKRLRRLHQRHGKVTLRLRVDVRKYVGTHDVVSGVIEGAADPQDEVWAIAHGAEPGAIDNASGVATCLEIARILEELIQAGVIPRPKRTIRLLSAYECYGFFGYLERVRRLQTPMAGVCIDSLGARPEVCGGRLEWHATIPSSAGFVDWVGERVLRAALRRSRSGYRLCMEPFQSTSDTQIGDPKYGYPCPWITTHHQKPRQGFDAYHSSADTIGLLSRRGLATCAAGMAGYLYYLADAGSRDVVELASVETERMIGRLRAGRRWSSHEIDYVRASHNLSMTHLQRWMWGGDRADIVGHLAACEDAVARAARGTSRRAERSARVPARARRIPRRTAALAPITENVPAPIAQRLSRGRLSQWAHYWADGKRNLAEIARCIACESAGVLSPGGQGKIADIELERVIEHFVALAELGYVVLPELDDMVAKSQLVADLRKLGVEAGMDLMVHSSLRSIGEVAGGADTVVDALLAAVGRSGTLVMPSFNHKAAQVYNPMTTPTTNGAIPDAMWRRRTAARSVHATHAVAAIGPRATWYCEDHLTSGIWTPDSPIGRLIHTGGYILALGVTHESSTAYHVAEESVPAPCNDPFGNIDRIVCPDGTVEEVWGLAFRSGGGPVALSKLDETFDRRGLQQRGKVGKADCGLVKALDLWKVRREHLRKACPGCRVKPRYRDE